MNFPTIQKTWIWRHVETNTGDKNLDAMNAFIEIIVSMKAAGATIQHWADGTTYGTGDHTFANTDYVSSQTAKTYAVLRFPSISGSSKDVLIGFGYYTTSSYNKLWLQISDSGFSAGNLTTLPSASDTVNVANGISGGYSIVLADYITGDNTTKKIIHTCYTSDGSAWWCFAARQNKVVAMFGIAEADCDTEVPSSEHWFCGGAFDDGADADVCTESNFHDATNLYNYSAALGGVVSYYATSECAVNGLVTNATRSAVPNPRNSNSWPLSAIGTWTETSPTYAWGKDFRLIDMWWCPANNGVGCYYSDDGFTKKICSMGELAVPWDDTAGVWS